MLDVLRRVWKKRGRLSRLIIYQSKGVPSPSAYYDRFGGLRRPYRLIG
jgi:hypothetical protein